MTSPSRTSRSSNLALSLAALIRCTQKEHFSMTPFCRTVTSGFSCQFKGSGRAKVNQLNRRTL